LVSTEVPAALVLDPRDPVTFRELTDPGSRQSQLFAGLTAATPVGMPWAETRQCEVLDFISVQCRVPVGLGASEVTGRHESLHGAGCYSQYLCGFADRQPHERSMVHESARAPG
jgi:hypothetical protein